MKTLLAFALAALAILAGCTSTPTQTQTATQIDTQYEYGTFAGLPQRPSLMN
jgi:uncharacterized lipoprotein YajG